MGFPSNIKQYIVYDLKTHNISISPNVVFFEFCFPKIDVSNTSENDSQVYFHPPYIQCIEFDDKITNNLDSHNVVDTDNVVNESGLTSEKSFSY